MLGVSRTAALALAESIQPGGTGPGEPGRKTNAWQLELHRSHYAGTGAVQPDTVARRMWGLDYSALSPMVRQAYEGPLAQGQRLRGNQNALLNGRRAVDSPDRVSQFVNAYTIPYQQLFSPGSTRPGVQSDYGWNSPSGRNMGLTGRKAAQPTLQIPLTSQTIPVRMPWNVGQ